jgi:hypothetical protein
MTNKPEVVMTLLSGEQLVRLIDHEKLAARCEKLRKDTVLGRYVLAKREPDGCVIDSGERHRKQGGGE